MLFHPFIQSAKHCFCVPDGWRHKARHWRWTDKSTDLRRRQTPHGCFAHGHICKWAHLLCSRWPHARQEHNFWGFRRILPEPTNLASRLKGGLHFRKRTNRCSCARKKVAVDKRYGFPLQWISVIQRARTIEEWTLNSHDGYKLSMARLDWGLVRYENVKELPVYQWACKSHRLTLALWNDDHL